MTSLPSPIYDYLTGPKRGLSPEVITAYGLHFRHPYIRIPVQRPDGTIFHKLRLDPRLQNDHFYKDRAKYMTEKGGSRTLFKTHSFESSRQVWITEGEFDTLRLASAGLAAASSTTGATNWDDEWSPLFKDKSVVLWYDNDEAGIEGAEKVRNSLIGHAYAIWTITKEESSPIKSNDVTDILSEIHPTFHSYFLKHLFRTGGALGFRAKKTPTNARQRPDRPAVNFEAPDADIVEALERYGVILKKRGREWTGKCIAHDDKNPSMSVNPEKGVLHCHACGFSANAYGVVMHIESCDFKEAKKILFPDLDTEKK